MVRRLRGLACAAVWAVAPLAATALGSCRPSPRAAVPVAPAAHAGTTITADEIARMSVRTAWDVVRLRAPRLSFGLDAAGRPTQVRIQEPRSLNADETPLLVVDGVPVSDIEYLNQIPASDVHAIHILNAEAAQPLYGLRAFGGAVVVETKRGR